VEPPIDVPLMHAPKNPQALINELHGPQHLQHNINNTFYKTLTNDGDVGMLSSYPSTIKHVSPI
jgi:hypothetical protein